VAGTDYKWIENWKKDHPRGVIITYVNSDVYVKSLSDYTCTSRNAAAVLRRVAARNPGEKILFCPDKFLGWTMRAITGLSPSVVDVYDQQFGGCNACCNVHERADKDALDAAMDEHPEAELLIHPESGCITSMCKIYQNEKPNVRSYYLSTEQMVHHAITSPADEFVVATEKGMLYRLRKEVPGKKFFPVSQSMECEFMKANNFEKLLRSLREDRLEIVLCDDCCDPKNPRQDERTFHIQKSIAKKAKLAIDRMLSIQ